MYILGPTDKNLGLGFSCKKMPLGVKIVLLCMLLIQFLNISDARMGNISIYAKRSIHADYKENCFSAH